MPNTEVFFADTYAIVEIIGGNPNYEAYTSAILVTNAFNLTELYYALLKDYGKKIADRYLGVYAHCSIPISTSAIQNGMQFKLANKKDRLSYADCVGYSLAAELGVKFLTGDGKFEGVDNVEFVK